MTEKNNSKVIICETCGNTFDASKTNDTPCCQTPVKVTKSITVRVNALPPVFGTTLRC